MKPDLDRWLDNPLVRVEHRGHSTAPAPALWQAAREVTLAETSMLGRLVRWRIPGTALNISFDQLFRTPPFIVLEESEDHGRSALVCGLVGRIWTLRRDYPRLDEPEEFRDWSRRGTARVLFAHWIETPDPDPGHGATLASEARVEAIGSQGRLGVAAVRPLVRTFGHLIESDGIVAAVRRAEGRSAVRPVQSG
jgi:hypothetical protein